MGFVRGSGGGSFITAKQYVSEIIFKDGTSQISSATPSVNFTSTGTTGCGILMSADNGVNWENCTNNVSHVFSNVGTALRIKVIAQSGWVIGAKTESDGKTYTPAIKVEYVTF